MLFGAIKNIAIVIALVGVLYGITRLSPQLKNQITDKASQVLGVKETPSVQGKSLPESLKKDANEQMEGIKEKAFDVSINDVLRSVERLRKIPSDMNKVKDAAEEQIRGYFMK